MDKNFTIDAEVRLFAHWHTVTETPEEKAKRESIDDRLGKLAVALDESVRVLVDEFI